MNPVQHANISVKRRGGELEDYIDIHALIDSTKMLCTDSRHRILHTFWGVQEVIIPIFGHHFENSAGKSIEVKDLCEKDHLLVDFHHRLYSPITKPTFACLAFLLFNFLLIVTLLKQTHLKQ